MTSALARVGIVAIAVMNVNVGDAYCQLKPHVFTASYDDAQMSLRVAPGPRDSTLLVIRRHGGATSSLKIPNNPISISSFHKGVDDKVILVADDGDPIVGVYVFDERTATIIDKFLGFSDVAVSPNGRLILFTRLFVLHPNGTDDVDQSNYAMLYDVSKPPGQNRHVPRLDDVLDNVGALVYPHKFGREQPKHGNDPIEHLFQWDYYWSPDSTKAVFFDAQFPGDPISLGAHNEGNVIASPNVPPSAALNLVLVDFSGPSPIARKLDTHLCHGEPGSPMCYPPQPKFTFGPTGVTLESVQTEQSHWDLHVTYKYSDFIRR